MGNSALTRRGIEILSAMVIVIAIAYVSTVIRHDNASNYNRLAVNANTTAAIGSTPNSDNNTPETTLASDGAIAGADAVQADMDKEPVNVDGINMAEPSGTDDVMKTEHDGQVKEAAEAGSIQTGQAEESHVNSDAVRVYKYINTSKLNVRKGPSAETEKLDTLSYGARVQFLESHGEWTKIITADNIEGYVLAEYVVDSLPPVYKYINASKLNVRKGPSAETEKLDTLSYGARVQFLESHGEWMKIITSNNIEGYVLAEYAVDSLPPVYKYISASKLNVRKGPSAETEKLDTLSYGVRVQVFEQDGEWTRIITKDNVEGYVLSAYVVSEINQVSRSDSSTSSAAYNADLAASVLEYAKQFVGVKYVYGGSTPKGFDCSGFTKYVFQKFNINVPRSSEDYYGVGTKISRNDMKPGDILLFDVYNNHQLGHVGIYMGKDQFIHASTSKGKVVIAKLSEYSGNLLGIRRVIK